MRTLVRSGCNTLEALLDEEGSAHEEIAVSPRDVEIAAERKTRELARLLYRQPKVTMDDTYSGHRYVWISWPTDARRFEAGKDECEAWCNAARELEGDAAFLIKQLQAAMSGQ